MALAHRPRRNQMRTGPVVVQKASSGGALEASSLGALPCRLDYRDFCFIHLPFWWSWKSFSTSAMIFPLYSGVKDFFAGGHQAGE